MNGDFLFEYISFPAVILVSAMAIMPSLTVIPKQYVIKWNCVILRNITIFIYKPILLNRLNVKIGVKYSLADVIVFSLEII